MAEDAPDIGRVVNSISAATKISKQLDMLSRFINDNSVGAVTNMIKDVIDKAPSNMNYAKVYLLFLDYNILYKTLGKSTLDQILFSVKGTQSIKGYEEILTGTKKLKKKQLNLFKAKIAILLQLVYLLRERIAEEGMPPMKIDTQKVTSTILKKLDGRMKMQIDLNDYGKGYWNLLVSLLQEADFRSEDKVAYELVLSDDMINMYSTGANLAGGAKGEGGQSALSDTMLARLGRNVIKRLGLLLRTAKMYQSSEHPSVQLGLESLHSTVSEVLENRPSITFTRMGSDLLIDDVKNRKQEKFIDDFIRQLDERNLNSITLTQGISVEEVRVLVSIFAMNRGQLKKSGGAATVLSKSSVSNVIVDQFKYGLISADQEEATEAVSQDDKMVENIVFTELVGRLKDGKELGDLKSEDVGAAFKQLISGAFRKDQNARKNLAQMLMAIDPSLAERALFAKGSVRSDLQWSSAQRMIDELLVELSKGSVDDRLSILENMEKMAELAITKNKDTTLTVIIEKILERMRLRERNFDVMEKVVQTLAEIIKHLIVNGKYQMAFETLTQMMQIKTRCEHIPEEKKDKLHYSLPTMVDKSMEKITDPDVVDALFRDMDTDSLETVDRIVKIMEILNTEQVVIKLLEGFVFESRSIRSRCFQALVAIGGKSYSVASWKLKSLNDEDVFSRENNDTLEDNAYYLARNCVELVAKVGKEKSFELLKDISDDPDPRLRRDIMLNISDIDADEGAFLAKLRLTDKDPLVVKAAISKLGTMKATSAQRELIDLFFAQPEYRDTVVKALSFCGDEEAENMLLNATKLRFGGNTAKIFRANPELVKSAIKALGQCGASLTLRPMQKFTRRLGNPMFRIFFFPMSYFRNSKELLKVSRETLSRVEFRVKSAKAS